MFASRVLPFAGGVLTFAGGVLTFAGFVRFVPIFGLLLAIGCQIGRNMVHWCHIRSPVHPSIDSAGAVKRHFATARQKGHHAEAPDQPDP